jgi:two-component system, cell cycle response regulator
MNASRPRVLIADDSMVVRAVIGKQLGSEGYELLEAADGDAALAACRSSAPDVVLLDVEMPGQTGYDVLSAMQAEPDLAGIPVIFLSGQVSADHVATGLRLGAHDYLRKPVETGELLARVTAALRTKVLQDRLRRDNAQLRQLAPIDPLTGVLDVRGLQERLEALAEDARLHGRCLAGVLLDVQALDTINNAFGWAAGDEVLRSLAELVSGMIAPGEVVGRCGPDEFLILLPNTDLVTADALSRSLQARVGSSSVRVGSDDVAVRIAVGAAATEDGSAEALVRSLQEAITTGVAQPAGGPPPVAPAAPAPAPAAVASPPPAAEPVPAVVVAPPVSSSPARPVPPPPMASPAFDEESAPGHARKKSRWGIGR